MTYEKAVEGIRIIAGKDLLPQGWIFTIELAADNAHSQKMVKWLNDTETNLNHTTLEGGSFYGYAVEMARRILDFFDKKSKRN